MKIYINKVKNRITFKIETGYYFKLWTPETIKSLGSAKSKITENENGVNVPNLEITEVVLVHCNIVNNNYQHNSRVFLFQRVFLFFWSNFIVPFHQLLDISPKKGCLFF